MPSIQTGLSVLVPKLRESQFIVMRGLPDQYQEVLMSTWRRNQAQGKHRPRRHSRCSGRGILYKGHRSCSRTGATSQREPTWPNAPRGKFRSGGVRIRSTRGRQQLPAQVRLLTPRAQLFVTEYSLLAQEISFLTRLVGPTPSIRP